MGEGLGGGDVPTVVVVWSGGVGGDEALGVGELGTLGHLVVLLSGSAVWM